MRTVVLVLLAAVLWLGAVGTTPAAPQRCRPPQNATIVARNSLAIVWEARQQLVACLRSGRAVVVDPNTEDEDVRAWLAGRFVAVASHWCDVREGGSCLYTRVVVWDMRSRRLVSTRSYDDVNGDDVYGQLDDLRLTSRGAAVLLLEVAANREVWLLCPSGAERLAAGEAIAPRLQRTGDLVCWTDATTGGRTGVRPTCGRQGSR